MKTLYSRHFLRGGAYTLHIVQHNLIKHHSHVCLKADLPGHGGERGEVPQTADRRQERRRDQSSVTTLAKKDNAQNCIL